MAAEAVTVEAMEAEATEDNRSQPDLSIMYQ